MNEHDKIFKEIESMLSIWEARPKKSGLLQPVIPIIFYHGRRRWKYRSFAESFTGIDKHLTPFIPCFDYLLTDLSRYDAEAIRETIFKRDANRILMQLLKFIGDERLVDKHFEEIFTPGVGYFATPEGESFLISILVYIYRTVNLAPESVTKRLTDISYDGGQIAMTTATRLHEEGKKLGFELGRQDGIAEGKMQGIQEGIERGIRQGKQQGIAEGMKKTRQENARRMLEKGLSSGLISEVTGLSSAEIEALQDGEK